MKGREGKRLGGQINDALSSGLGSNDDYLIKETLIPSADLDYKTIKQMSQSLEQIYGWILGCEPSSLSLLAVVVSFIIIPELLLPYFKQEIGEGDSKPKCQAEFE